MMTTIFVWMVVLWSALVALANMRDPQPNPRHSAISVALHTVLVVMGICILCGAQ